MPHHAVFFDMDKDFVKPNFRLEVQNFVKENQNLNFYLVGRASKIGTDAYNKELSARRVRSLKTVLKKSGMPEKQIKAFWCGFQAPQLTREVADQYGIDPRKYDEDPFKLNQSVVMFAYSPGQYFPGAVNTMEEQVHNKTLPSAKGKKSKSNKDTVTQTFGKPS